VRQRNRVFSQVAAYRIFSQNLSDARQAAPPEQIDTAFVSQDFLSLLGVTPLVGPGFTQEPAEAQLTLLPWIESPRMCMALINDHLLAHLGAKGIVFNSSPKTG
jgi:hypothetical protein